MLLLACLAVLAVGLSGYRAVSLWAQEAVNERLGVLADGRAKALERRWDRLLAELAVQAHSAIRCPVWTRSAAGWNSPSIAR